MMTITEVLMAVAFFMWIRGEVDVAVKAGNCYAVAAGVGVVLGAVSVVAMWWLRVQLVRRTGSLPSRVHGAWGVTFLVVQLVWIGMAAPLGEWISVAVLERMK